MATEPPLWQVGRVGHAPRVLRTPFNLLSPWCSVDQPDPAADPPKKKARVFTEEVKQRQVSHWDWDYLPREELDRQQAGEAGDVPDLKANEDPST